MKITLQQKFKSLEPLTVELPNFVILTGVNGAGKTQILTAAIQGSNLLKIYDDNLELIQKKYVTSHTLSPNDSTVVTREHLDRNMQSLWNQYDQHKLKLNKTNKTNNKSIHFEQLFGGKSSPQYKVINKIAKNACKSLDELTLNDFYEHCPLEDGLTKNEVFYQNFSSLFKRYQVKQEENSYREFRNKQKSEIDVTYLTKAQFETIYGEPPWDFVNKIIKEASLDYRVNSPINQHRDEPFELKLVNNYNDVEIKFSDLSSGEKVLMSLAFALYNSNLDIDFPEVLLMDEPDASLHPSMCKKFLDVIQHVFVNEKKVKVIITTHSPSTVALAPEESIFIVNKTGNRIEKTSKDKALKILTSGVPSFSVNYENRRQVFVESPYDVVYYEKMYQQLSNYLIPEVSLSFISSGESRTDKNGTKISNCGQVINITDTLRKAGNKFVSGIIDWDNSNISSESVKVLGNGSRYSIENYILDPLLIATLLLREKIISKEDLSLRVNETFIDLKNFDKERLQIVADYVVTKVSAIVNPKDNTLVVAKLMNGIEINLPKWYLHYHGHTLEEQVLKAFPQLAAIKKGKEEALKVEILNKVVDDIPSILSHDILDVLKSVQEI